MTKIEKLEKAYGKNIKKTVKNIKKYHDTQEGAAITMVLPRGLQKSKQGRKKIETWKKTFLTKTKYKK